MRERVREQWEQESDGSKRVRERETNRVRERRETERQRCRETERQRRYKR